MDPWWRAIRPLLMPLSAREPMSFEELGRAVAAKLPYGLGAPERFGLPPALEPYLAQLGAQTWMSQRIAMDLILVPASAIATSLDYARRLHEDEALIREVGPWLELGTIRDRNALFLCCDRTRADFGEVFEGEDDHPWLNGDQFLVPQGPITTWQASLIRPNQRWDRGSMLIALLPEETAALARVRESDDPWQVLVAVRDLEMALRPDRAWAHATGAPDRVLLAKSWGTLTAALGGAGERLYEDPYAVAVQLDAAEVARRAALGPAAVEPESYVCVWKAGGDSELVEAAGELARFFRRAAAAGASVLATGTPPHDWESEPADESADPDSN
jgi:hypothetical protein